MKIGSIELSSPYILAPMAGYGDVAFRRLCRDYGAALTVTEMVSAKGLCYRNCKTEELLRLAPNESPSCVQLFGSDPECFRKALSLGVLDRFDIIDVNMGCPVPKVTKCGEGSALMRDPTRAAEIVRACIESGKGRPVTVKHRLGITDSKNAESFACTMASAGASAITVHGRTAAQGYSGKADWEAIGRVAESVPVPVVGNGDITSLLEADEKISRYGVSAVAIGRYALGNPQIFSGENKADLINVILRHLDYALEYFPEDVAVRTMRKHLVRYLSGIPNSKELKMQASVIGSVSELKSLLAEKLK